METYISLSIETHLFFARIMKEHSFFLQAGFPCKNENWIQRADFFRIQFENLLRDAVQISNGIVNCDILNSNEIVTEFTLPAEERTSKLTGVPFDFEITKAEKSMRCGLPIRRNNHLLRSVNHLNELALRLLNGLIELKEDILCEVNNGCLFTANYPLLIEHILREAKLYRSILTDLRQTRRISNRILQDQELFWDQIMMEHALFIRGLLDPTEEKLIETADDFAEDYRRLLEMAREQDCRASEELTRKTLKETLKYRDFKAAGTEGILECEIASIILPLLADHVLREANHFIRILENTEDQ